jgi:hypothetical protein
MATMVAGGRIVDRKLHRGGKRPGDFALSRGLEPPLALPLVVLAGDVSSRRKSTPGKPQ